MHSKYKLWEFFQNRPEVLNKKIPVVAVASYDPLAFYLIKSSIDKSRYFSEEKLNVLVGKEVNTQWIDNELKSLSLFGNQDSYLIHFAENLSSTVKEALLKVEDLLLDGRFLLLSFQKEDSFFKALQKLDSPLIETISIQAPAFWEDKELLNFLCKREQIQLAGPAIEYFCQHIVFELDAYYQAVQQLKINFGTEKPLTVKDLVSVLETTRFDQFEMANLFGMKQLQKFYGKLIEQYQNEGDILSTLYFLQSHLIKVYDPSYLKEKSKLNRYDKQIIGHAKHWSPDKALRALNYVAKLIFMAKRKDTLLEVELKRGLLKTMSF